jgi:hypothetical protein
MAVHFHAAPSGMSNPPSTCRVDTRVQTRGPLLLVQLTPSVHDTTRLAMNKHMLDVARRCPGTQGRCSILPMA